MQKLNWQQCQTPFSILHCLSVVPSSGVKPPSIFWSFWSFWLTSLPVTYNMSLLFFLQKYKTISTPRTDWHLVMSNIWHASIQNNEIQKEKNNQVHIENRAFVEFQCCHGNVNKNAVAVPLNIFSMCNFAEQIYVRKCQCQIWV